MQARADTSIQYIAHGECMECMEEELVNLITKIAGVLSATRAGELLVAAWGHTWSRLSLLSHLQRYISWDLAALRLASMCDAHFVVEFVFSGKGRLHKSLPSCWATTALSSQLQFQLQLQFATVATSALNPSWPLGRT